MLYKLSTYVSRKLCKGAYLLEVSGIVVEEDVFSLSSDLTQSIIKGVTRGLRACRYNVKHEDTVCICVQNSKVYNWLNRAEENPDYMDDLEELYNTLNSLDCMYKFVLDKNSYAKTFLESSEVLSKSRVKGSGVAEAFEGM